MLRILALALVLVLSPLLFAPVMAWAADPASTPAPCAAAAPACTEWIVLRGGPARAMVYRSFPLDAPNPHIRRALIMIHGALRNADHYFATANAAAFLAGASGDTLVIAPHFASGEAGCSDKLRPAEVSWSCIGDSWRSGGGAASDHRLTSFELVDALLRKLADKKVFPSLGAVVVAGHSAGGQFVSRYEMAGRVGDVPGLAVAYVVANPSSYAWPDATRMRPVGDGSPAAAAGAWKDEKPHVDFSFGPFDEAEVPGFDRWPYGLENRTRGYTAGMTAEQLRDQLASRPTTYLLGQVDTFPLGGFDDSPQAMAQGPTRRARGEAFVKYINEHLAAKAKVMIVPECGHNDRCIFTTDAVLPLLFPDLDR